MCQKLEPLSSLQVFRLPDVPIYTHSAVSEDAVLTFEDTIPLALKASAPVICCLRGKNIIQI